ncbi:MAG: hypothetical protein KJ915_08120 [Candidatus Omnitrophica bacterium]|nr:hypothetical protein [Candidatus Omnitrophota bacterium]
MIIINKVHDYQENNLLFNRVDAKLELLNKKLSISLIALKKNFSKQKKCSAVLASVVTEYMFGLIKYRRIFV